MIKTYATKEYGIQKILIVTVIICVNKKKESKYSKL